ncbi:MAG: hypothetical protein ACSHWS_16310 [Sulfitobacter sp.]
MKGDIIDNRSLGVWIDGADLQNARAVAIRSALRALPHLTSQQDTLWQDRDVRFEDIAMRAFRCLIVCTASNVLDDRELGISREQAAHDVERVGRLAGTSMPGLSGEHFWAIFGALISFPEARAISPTRGGDGQREALKRVLQGTFDIWDDHEPKGLSLLQRYAGAPVSIDAHALQDISQVSEIYHRKLWHGSPVPSPTNQSLSEFWTLLQNEGANWQFWQDWYQGFLDGTPLNWNLQRDVALIPDEDWRKGPEHIAKVIHGIRVPYRLREEIVELEHQLANVSPGHGQMGHNRPPEPIEDAQLTQIPEIIWADIGAIERELVTPKPDPERLGVLASRFRMSAAQIGTLVKDTAYDHTKAVLAGAAGSASAIYWPKIAGILQSISTTIDEWIAYLLWVI